MKLLNHIYWTRKTRFALDTDLYGHWVAFAVEEGALRYGLGAVEGETGEGPPEGESGSAGPGDIVLCPPGVPFARETETPLTFHYLQFSAGTLTLPGGKHRPHDQKRLYANFAYLRRHAESGEMFARRWKEHLLRDLLELLELERAEAEQQEESGPALTEDALMMEAADVIASDIGGSFSLAVLADRLGLSPVQLTRRFRSAYGQTPSDYRKALRLNRARTLLRDTEMTLAEIAGAAGYENGFYLSRVFSKTFGITPSAFRNRHRV